MTTAVITACPYCGLTGPDFDESERPADYCQHDPAEIEGIAGVWVNYVDQVDIDRSVRLSLGAV